MSFILDENQQQHLLVILNDINRHIYESNAALQSSNSSSGGGVSNGTTSSGKGPGKVGLGGARHPKRLSSIDQQHNIASTAPLPDLITGFNQNNKQPLTDFIISTNRYFKSFFKFTSILIGTNDSQIPSPVQSSKGKNVLLWLSQFYSKLLLEHLNFEYIFDVAPELLVTTNASGEVSIGLQQSQVPQPSLTPTKKDQQQHHQQHHINQQKQQQQQTTKLILNGTSLQVIPVSSSTNLLSNQQQQGTPQGSSGPVAKEEHQQLDLMSRAVHLHELHQLQNATNSPNNQQQQMYTMTHHLDQQNQTQQQHQLHQQDLDFIVQQQQQQLENQMLVYQVSSQIIKDLTFLILLVIYLFYKLRFIFPNLTGRFEVSWKYFASFERELDPSFLYDNFIEFIQAELHQQRASNERRSELLRQEVIQLEKISKIVDKEIETEIGRLVQMQSRQQQQQQQQQQQHNQQSQQTHKILGATSSSGGGQQIRGPTVQLSTVSGSGSISLMDLKGLKLAAATSASNNSGGNASNLAISITGNGGVASTVGSSLISPSSGTGTSAVINTSGQQHNSRACPECGKAFRNTYKLNRHLYVHKDPSEKPYVCDWAGCAYRSISRNDLNRHKMIHTGEKPYLCDIEGCEKRYSRPDKLRHHKQTAHFKESAKKEQICIYPGCNFQCVTKSELNRHQQAHDKADEKQLLQLHKQQQQQHAQKTSAGVVNVNTVAAQAIVSAATAATLQGALLSSKVVDGTTEYVVPISISTTPQDIASVIAASSVMGAPQQAHSLVSGHHQQQQQHLSQQQSQQQQHQLNMSMLSGSGNPQSSSVVNHLMAAHHQGLNISDLATDSRLAAVAAAAVRNSQQQQNSATSLVQTLTGGGGPGTPVSGIVSESGQIVIVPTVVGGGGVPQNNGGNNSQQQHQQIQIPISSVAISSGGPNNAVTIAAVSNNAGGAVANAGAAGQRLNTVSVWSS